MPGRIAHLGRRLTGALRYCGAGAGDLLLPATCGACAAAEVAADGLCGPCGQRLLAMVALPYCPRCGATVGPNIPVREDGCAACPPTLGRFAQVIRLGPYAPPLRQAIRELKYRRLEALLGRLGELLAMAVEARLGEYPADVVVPVAMHWRRRWSRGFDHAAALARRLARRLDLPLGNELVRVRHTPPQARLSRTARIEMIRGAFAVRSAAAIEGAHVLLVDDVTTTGATAGEATRMLLNAGALRVTLVVVAKAEPPTAYGAHFRERPPAAGKP